MVIQSSVVFLNFKLIVKRKKKKKQRKEANVIITNKNNHLQSLCYHHFVETIQTNLFKRHLPDTTQPFLTKTKMVLQLSL